MTDSVAQDLLQSFVRRIESLEDEIGALNGDKSEVYKEAKGDGFDVKVLRKVIADRRKDASERNEFDEVYQLYWDAIHGVVRAHVEIIEEFDADGVERAAESPRFESVQGAREAHRPATYGQLVTAGETATYPRASSNGVDGVPEGQGETGAGTEGAIPSTGSNSQPVSGMLDAGTRDGLAGPAWTADPQPANIKPAPITDLTQPNPICRDPGDCGVYASWHHPCLACKRAAAVRTAA